MKRTPILALAVAVLAACDGAPPTAPAAGERGPAGDLTPAELCFNPSGSVVAEFAETGVNHPAGGETFAVIQGVTDGDIIADAYAWVDFLSGTPGESPRAIAIRMRHLYVDPGLEWMVWTEDEGVLAPVGEGLYQFNNRLRVVGGTGRLAGATGLLLSHGTVDFIGNEILLDYHGRLCLAVD